MSQSDDRTPRTDRREPRAGGRIPGRLALACLILALGLGLPFTVCLASGGGDQSAPWMRSLALAAGAPLALVLSIVGFYRDPESVALQALGVVALLGLVLVWVPALKEHRRVARLPSGPPPVSPVGPVAPSGRWAGEELPRVALETSEGEITLELFEDDAPNTAANFVHLTGAGFYDGTLFHRVVKGYMMQGGDPLTRRPDEARWGTGGPGYRIEDERPKNPGWKHERGMVSMASAGPHTAGSQFFIVFGAAAHCDGQYTVFGRVVDGMAVVDRIDQTLATELTGKPKKPIELRRARVVRRRDHAYRPITLPPLR